MGHPQHQLPPEHVSAAELVLHQDTKWEYEHDDNEWEYEYDDNETEDCYFTLDLTTHVPDALTRKYDTATGTQPSLQILDVHTRNPLVKFDGGIYSCYWSTDLGTQFHIAQAGVTPHPKRAGTVLDVIACSQARLIGKPVTLKQKNFNVAAGRAQSPSENDVADLGDDEAPSVPTTLNDPTQPLVIPRELCKDSTAESQASFLEKLSQIKLKKGETDPVPMYSIRIHRDPPNKDELRKRAMEDDAARKQDDAAVAADKPRKRRKRLTAVEKGLLPSDSPYAALAGRQARAAIGARVGFQGQAPGALNSHKRKSKRRQTDDTEVGLPDDADDGDAAAPAEQDSDFQMGDPS